MLPRERKQKQTEKKAAVPESLKRAVQEEQGEGDVGFDINLVYASVFVTMLLFIVILWYLYEVFYLA